MVRGIVTMVWGGVLMLGGVTGSVVLRGTLLTFPVVLLGMVVIAIGFFRIAAAAGDSLRIDDPKMINNVLLKDEKYLEYLRAKAENEQRAARQATVEKQRPKRNELESILNAHPAARAQIDELLARVGPHLDADERLNLALETARRLI